MKFYKIIILIVSFVMLTSASAFSEVVDKIIAVVNDEIITMKEFNAALGPYLKRIEETYKGGDKEKLIEDTRAIVLQRLIDNLLIEYEAKKTGANIKDEEIMNILKDTLVKRKISMDDFLKKVEQDGGSLADVKKDIKSQLMRMKLMRWEIKSKIMISDQEIGKYYDQHREEYEGKEAVRINQILLRIPPDADAATKTKIRENARQIHKSALGGTPFEELAAKYSQGPEASQGGDVGFIEKGVMIPAVEEVAFELPLGQISDVIESDLGFHIIKVVDKRGAGLKPIATVRDEIKAKLEDEKLEKRYDEWIASVRKKAHIEIR